MISLATLKMAAKTGVLWIAIGVLAATNSCSYLVGRAHANTKQAEKALVVAQKEAKAVKKEVDTRTPVVSKKENRAAQASARVSRAKEDLYYATQNKASASNCDITDAELNAYGVLADEINQAANR